MSMNPSFTFAHVVADEQSMPCVVPTGPAITPMVIDDVRVHTSFTEIADKVVVDLKARETKGIANYGQSLHASNGRDALVDLYEELLDAVQYAKQVVVENKDDETTHTVRRVYRILWTQVLDVRDLLDEREQANVQA